MDNSKKPAEDRACDLASIETIQKAKRDCVDLSFFRMDQQKNQCTYGTKGLCCRICHMGPAGSPQNHRKAYAEQMPTPLLRVIFCERWQAG